MKPNLFNKAWNVVLASFMYFVTMVFLFDEIMYINGWVTIPLLPIFLTFIVGLSLIFIFGVVGNLVILLIARSKKSPEEPDDPWEEDKLALEDQD